MHSFDITLFIVAYIFGYAVSIVIFYKLNTIHDEDILEEKNMDLSTAILLSLLSWICIFIVIIVVIFSAVQHIFGKSKFNEKYKKMNERFMHKKRDKKDG